MPLGQECLCLFFLLKSKCFRRHFFWPYRSNITAFYPLKYRQDSQLLPEAQRASTATWSLKGHRNSKKAVDIARCQCEQQITITSALAECPMSLWIRAGEWLQPILLCSNMEQTTVRNSHNEKTVWSCSLSFLFSFHFAISCILSIMFNALLSSINSVKLCILRLSGPAPCEKCCCVACCGAAILTQAEGPLAQLPSALCPSGGIQALAGTSSAQKPARCWFMTEVRPRCGQAGEAEQSYAACAPLKSPSSHPAQGKHRGISALTRAHNAPLQHSHQHVPWGSAGAQSAYAPQQSLSARRCQLSLPACKVYPCKRRSVWTYRCLKGVGPEMQVGCVGILLGEVSPTNRVM